MDEIAKKVARIDPDSTAPVMMISAASGFINQSEKYSRDNAGQSLKKYTLLKKGELAYNHGASKLREFGCCFELKEESALIPYVYHAFAIRNEYAPYIAIYLNNPIMDRQLKRLVSSSVRMDGLLNISYDQYMTVQLNIPNTDEQIKLFSFISTLDSLIEKQKQLVNALKSYKRGALLSLFPKDSETTPKLRFSGFSEPWSCFKFSEITHATGTRNKDNIDLEPYAITNEHGFIRQSDAHEDFGYMKSTDRRAYIIVRPHSFAYNPARINVGSIGYYSGTNDVIVSSLYEVFQTTENVDDRFLWHWFKSYEFTKWIEKLQEGSVRLYFYYDKLCECQMLLPPLEEQRKISDFLDQIDRHILTSQQLYDTLQSAKRTLLQKMFI